MAIQAPSAKADIFDYTGALQTYTVANTGMYVITVSGAQGGSSAYSTGGEGAEVSGVIQLTASDVLNIVVGQQGGTGNFGSLHPGGGGGGSFVYDTSLLAVAGGGGGASNNHVNGGPGLTTTAGAAGGSDSSVAGAVGGAGGTAGSGGGGGQDSNSGAGGAGWQSAGADGLGPLNGVGGSSFPSFAGGAGDARDAPQTPYGGYGGGGGAGFWGGGGGGGYSGGGGGAGGGSAVTGGGGGGSYLATAFTNTTLQSGVQTGNGQVSILEAIDTAQPYYVASQVGSTVAPYFAGGTLLGDVSNVTDNFTLGNYAGNTIDPMAPTNFSGTFTGAGPLTIDGIGRVILSNSGGNTYSGVTTVNSGRLVAYATNAFSPNSAVVMANSAGALLDLNGHDNTIGGLSGGGANGGNVNINNATLTVNGGGIYGGSIYNSVVSGSLVVGSETLTLTGVNTYTGSTTIDTGATLALSGSGSIATSSNVNVNLNGTFDITQTTGGASIVSLSGYGFVALGDQTLTITGASGTFYGAIYEPGIGGGGTEGSLVLAGGTETLAGLNGYLGSTTIDTGATLALLGFGSISTSSGVAANGTLDISQTTQGASITSLSGSGAVFLGGQALTLTGANGTFSGAISDGGLGGSLVVAGGTETLTGANTYAGSTTINTGATLALSGPGSIAASSGVEANGTFDISQIAAGASIISLSGSGSVALGSKTLTLTGAGGTFSGSMTDGGIGLGMGGNLAIAGGTETLTGVSTYTGSTTIDTLATLALSGTGSIATSSNVNVNTDGTFDITQTTGGASIKSLSGYGFVALGDQTLTITGASGTFYGAIYEPGIGGGGTEGSLVLAGGTETLAGYFNGYLGSTTIDTGATLALSGAGSISTSSGVTDNGTFDISQAFARVSITSLSGSGAVALGDQILTLTGANGTFSGVIAGGGIGGGTSGYLIVTGGTETLTGQNTYSGSTRINSGATLALAGSGSIAMSSFVIADGTFDISQTASGASIADLGGSGAVALGSQTLTLTNAMELFTGVIADGGIGGGAGGSLTIAGGIAGLGGVNTYTGATTI
ncbi:MAG TPA: autotransporter-associated beta strand repeat-containing protein, partial [Caulobacteraceae bacterium]